MLNRSEVIFDQEKHTYTLGEKKLTGVTTILSAMLFKDKYSGVPDFVLEKARQRGTFVHETIELINSLGVESDDPDIVAYSKMMAESGLSVVESEFLISDNEAVASSIDSVAEKDGEYSLIDYKTTYTLDEDYLRWQLSIYRYLFRLQTGITAKHLYAGWIRGGEAKLIEIENPIDEETIKSLIACYVSGKEFVNPYPMAEKKSKEQLPAKYMELQNTIADIDANLRFWEAKKKELTDGVMCEMVDAGIYSWSGEIISFTRRADTIRKDFDKERFKKEHHDLYEEYIKETPVVGGVTLKVKKQK